MSSPAARPATKQDLAGMAAALADAFHDDPVMAYVFGPESPASQRHLTAFFRHEGGRHLRNQHVFTDDEHGGASYWDPPGHWKPGFRDDFGMAVPLPLGVNRRIPRALRGLAQVEKVHDQQPKDHYYLAVLGTRAAKQGTGVGSAMMAPVLAICDRDGVGAYLESSKERNVPFYRRHGFEVVQEIEFGKGGPTLWAMWRDPRPPGATEG
jgi:ribosomal protein S18 acetylase RimI-like enzyme